MPSRIATGVPIFKSPIWLNSEKSPWCKWESNSGSAALEADALTAKPTRWREIGDHSSQGSDLQTGALVAVLPDAWRCRISAGTGWPGFSGRDSKFELQVLSQCGCKKIVSGDQSVKYPLLLAGMWSCREINTLKTHPHLHPHLSCSLADRWGTTIDFTTNFLHSSRFVAFCSMMFNSRPVHSLILSSHRFLCLPRRLPPYTVPCRIVLARQDSLGHSKLAY